MDLRLGDGKGMLFRLMGPNFPVEVVVGEVLGGDSTDLNQALQRKDIKKSKIFAENAKNAPFPVYCVWRQSRSVSFHPKPGGHVS